jgi:hypothetical protein
MKHEDRRNAKIHHPDVGKEELWRMTSSRTSIVDRNANLEVPRGLVGDIPNRYNYDIVLN